MWINIVEQRWPQMTVWSIHIACWIPKGTNTNVMFIAFPLARTPLHATLWVRYLLLSGMTSRKCIGHMPNSILRVLENGQSCRRPCLTGAESFKFNIITVVKVIGVDNFCLRLTCSFLPVITWKRIACTHGNNSLQSYKNTVTCVDSAGVKLT